MNSTLRRTRVRLLAGVSGAVALSVLAVAGCSSSSSSSTSAAAPASSSSSPAAAAASAAAAVPLVVYSAQGYDSAMTKAFTKATGIPVQLDDNSTGPLLTQIEASKNNPNGPTLQALTSGQINLALVQSSAAIGATLSDKNIGIKYLSPATLLPSAIGIDAKASPAVQAEAEKFVSFVLSSAGQQVMQSGDPTGDSLYYPVVSGVNPLPSLPSLTSVKTQSISPYTWGPQEATINNWFDSNVGR